jgi:hypothetical protein
MRHAPNHTLSVTQRQSGTIYPISVRRANGTPLFTLAPWHIPYAAGVNGSSTPPSDPPVTTHMGEPVPPTLYNPEIEPDDVSDGSSVSEDEDTKSINVASGIPTQNPRNSSIPTLRTGPARPVGGPPCYPRPAVFPNQKPGPQHVPWPRGGPGIPWTAGVPNQWHIPQVPVNFPLHRAVHIPFLPANRWATLYGPRWRIYPQMQMLPYYIY